MYRASSIRLKVKNKTNGWKTFAARTSTRLKKGWQIYDYWPLHALSLNTASRVQHDSTSHVYDYISYTYYILYTFDVTRTRNARDEFYDLLKCTHVYYSRILLARRRPCQVETRVLWTFRSKRRPPSQQQLYHIIWYGLSWSEIL